MEKNEKQKQTEIGTHEIKRQAIEIVSPKRSNSPEIQTLEVRTHARTCMTRCLIEFFCTITLLLSLAISTRLLLTEHPSLIFCPSSAICFRTSTAIERWKFRTKIVVIGMPKRTSFRRSDLIGFPSCQKQFLRQRRWFASRSNRTGVAVVNRRKAKYTYPDELVGLFTRLRGLTEDVKTCYAYHAMLITVESVLILITNVTALTTSYINGVESKNIHLIGHSLMRLLFLFYVVRETHNTKLEVSTRDRRAWPLLYRTFETLCKCIRLAHRTVSNSGSMTGGRGWMAMSSIGATSQ